MHCFGPRDALKSSHASQCQINSFNCVSTTSHGSGYKQRYKSWSIGILDSKSCREAIILNTTHHILTATILVRIPRPLSHPSLSLPPCLAIFRLWSFCWCIRLAAWTARAAALFLGEGSAQVMYLRSSCTTEGICPFRGITKAFQKTLEPASANGFLLPFCYRSWRDDNQILQNE